MRICHRFLSATLLLTALTTLCISETAQVLTADDLKKFAQTTVPELMREENIPGAVFVFVKDSQVLVQQGFGFSNLEEKKPVDASKTIFPIGSVSKVFTATALVQLSDRGKIDLKTDVNRYLTKIKVPNTYPDPITGAHLLNHTSGLDEIRPGTQAKSPNEILLLPDFLKQKLVRVHPPGLITSYSTYGITLAGLLVEEISGMSYETYLRKNLWQPLNMKRTHVSTPSNLAADVAIGYASEDGKIERVGYEWYHTIPASSIRSTGEDMGHFLLAHLQSGEYAGQKIFSAEAAESMHRTQSTTHPKMPGWTYGFQEDDTNGLRIVEHGGDIAGFSTLMVLLPEQHAGFFIAHHLEGGNLRFKLKQKLLDRYFPDRRALKAPAPSPDPQGKLKKFEGLYRGNLFCHSCKNPLEVAEVEVKSNQDGTITVWDDRWVQTSPLLFVRMDGKRKIGFQEDSKTGRILQMSAGSWKVMEKIK